MAVSSITEHPLRSGRRHGPRTPTMPQSPSFSHGIYHQAMLGNVCMRTLAKDREPAQLIRLDGLALKGGWLRAGHNFWSTNPPPRPFAHKPLTLGCRCRRTPNPTQSVFPSQTATVDCHWNRHYLAVCSETWRPSSASNWPQVSLRQWDSSCAYSISVHRAKLQPRYRTATVAQFPAVESVVKR